MDNSKSALAQRLRYIQRTPWAILGESLRGFVADIQDPEKAAQLPSNFGSVRVGTTEVVPVRGVILNRASFFEGFGVASTEVLSSRLSAAANDDQVEAIVLDIDSPGGTAVGPEEVAEQIREIRKSKPVVAVANPLAASAAYYIASAASEIVAVPSGDVGSIGVIMFHLDLSEMDKAVGAKWTMFTAGRFKGEWTDTEPLSDAARERGQAIVDQSYFQFIRGVAKGRGVKASVVRSDYGEGRLLLSREALAAGMIDRLGTLEQTLMRLSGPARSRIQNRRGAELTLREFQQELQFYFGFTRDQADQVARQGFSAGLEPRDGADPVGPEDLHSEPRDGAETGDLDPRDGAAIVEAIERAQATLTA